MLPIFFTTINGCTTRADALTQHNLEAAVSELSSYLALPRLTTRARVDAFQLRALAYYRAGDYARATEDMEAAFKLEAPNNPKALTQYAIYLRRGGRLEDSLEAIAHARRLATDGTASIEYQKGLALAALARHEDAVTAFSQALKDDQSAQAALVDRSIYLDTLSLCTRCIKPLE